MDFFTVPTLTFGVIYCFFVISHNRRKHSALQCDPASGERMGLATIARGVSL
jgi:hypothetical protein